MSDSVVKPLGPDTWDAFAALVEKHNGVWGGCWCIFFHPDYAERGQGAETNRWLKQQLVNEGRAHAALVFDGDAAVAWTPPAGRPRRLSCTTPRGASSNRRDSTTSGRRGRTTA